MLAVTFDRYGPPDVLKIQDIPKPAPKDNEVLIKVRASTVSSGDCRVRSLTMPPGFGLLARPALGFNGPRQKILGSELSGDVEAVGKNVNRFKAGDKVFASTGSKLGCHVEYKCIAEDAAIAHKPENLSYEQAAALSFGGNTALHFLRKGNLRPGEKLLVNGASGSIGSTAVQLGKHLGAHVTGVCGPTNLDLVRSLGADAVIDYTKQDFTKSGVAYDVVLDTVGTAPYSRSAIVMAKGGRLLAVVGSLGAVATMPFISMLTDKKVVAGQATPRGEYQRFIVELASAGQYTPFIDRTFPIEKIADAHRYVDKGHKRGNVVVVF
jgi:NADPH:quinone reductase-like Zn-dependent oxidoreductase